MAGRTVAAEAAISTDQAVAFGPFQLVPDRRLLLEDGQPRHLRGREFDLLLALVEQAGQFVTKEALIEQVWPRANVSEANLRVQIGALRRSLGENGGDPRYIVNVTGRGYRFSAPVTRLEAAPQPAAQASPHHNLPARLKPTIGRDEIARRLITHLPHQRLVTVVGAGGIGKTTLALTVAEELVGAYGFGARFVDLAALTDPQRVPSALASTLGISVVSEDPTEAVVKFLQDKQILLVLDNCEHVIETAAALVEKVLRGARDVHILATSREPLRTDGEWLFRLPPLEAPPRGATPTAQEALAYPAVELFVDRAQSVRDGFELTDADAATVAELCRRLDGNPLAIELAAARVDVFGVQGLAARLNESFSLLTQGRRTALPRHQTLRATLDWSYETLTGAEQSVLRRLAVFQGDFTLDSAVAVAAGGDLRADEVVEIVAELTAKSLVNAEAGGGTTHFRLFVTARAYALEKLTESGERDGAERRHAELMRDLFTGLRPRWEWADAPQAMAPYGRQLDNVRAALDWAFAHDAVGEIGVPLTVAAIPLWWSQFLVDECSARIERALASLAPAQDERAEMQLLVELCAARLQIDGSGPHMAQAAARALAIAERLADADYRLRAAWSLMVNAYNAGEYRIALARAEQFCAIAEVTAQPDAAAIGDRLVGNVLFVLGDQAGARRRIERMLARYVPPPNRSHLVRFQYDQRVVSLCTLAQILWLQGFADQAMATAEQALQEASASGHTVSQHYALTQAACPIAIVTGDLEAADRCVARLVEHALRHRPYNVWGPTFAALAMIGAGDLEAGAAALRQALAQMTEAAFGPRHNRFYGELAEALIRTGQVGEAETILERMIERSSARGEHWCDAEIERLRAECLVSRGATGEAEVLLGQALGIARSQGALAWELRAATSLARLHGDQGRAALGHALLAPVHARFTEGRGTPDLVAARVLLDALGG